MKLLVVLGLVLSLVGCSGNESDIEVEEVVEEEDNPVVDLDAIYKELGIDNREDWKQKRLQDYRERMDGLNEEDSLAYEESLWERNGGLEGMIEQLMPLLTHPYLSSLSAYKYNDTLGLYYETYGYHITENDDDYNKLKEAYWREMEESGLCHNPFHTYSNTDCTNKPDSAFYLVEAYVNGTINEALAEARDKKVEEKQADGSKVVEEVVEVEEEPEEELTLERIMAVREAQEYINFMPFSREGLIDQLEYEGYSYEDAKYAVDHIVVDWKVQCALDAKAYLEYSAFSRSGLYDQLEYEGYTHEQIEYGLKAVGY